MDHGGRGDYPDRRAPPGDAVIVALVPGIILATTINWDMWLVACLTGVLIGPGTAKKVFPLFFFGAVIVLAICSGRYRTLVVSVAGAALSWWRGTYRRRS